MTFVLVSGKAGAGKSTFGNHLVTVLTRHGLRCRQVELGALLKEITFELLRLFNVPIDSIDDLYNEHKCRYRTYLQQIGTECFRKVFGDDVWCELLMMKLEKMNVMDDVIVITDVRFASERRYFESMGNGTITVRVECEHPRMTMTEAEMLHASETEADGWKYDSRFVNTMDDRIVKDVERWAEKWIIGEDVRNENDEMDDVELSGLEADADEIVRGRSETVNEIDETLKDDGHVDTTDDVMDTHHIDTIPVTVMDDVMDTAHVDTVNDNSRIDIVDDAELQLKLPAGNLRRQLETQAADITTGPEKNRGRPGTRFPAGVVELRSQALRSGFPAGVVKTLEPVEQRFEFVRRSE